MNTTYKINEKDVYGYKVKFNEHEFELCLLINYFNEKEEYRGQEVEVLPAVYCKREVYFNKFARVENFILGKIAPLFNIQLGDYIIVCKNIRDYFKIVGVENNAMIIHKNSAYEERNEYISTEILPYPRMLGGGCLMWSIFRSIGLYDSCTTYSALSASKVLRITATNNELNDAICRKSDCNAFIEKMLDGTFIPIFKDEDSFNAITLSIHNGKVDLDEGKHRVCAAKRFNIDKIPATICYITSEEEVSKSDRNMFKYLPPWNIDKNEICKQILEDCTKTYYNLGLDDEDIRILNETINDDVYLQYIEKKAGKTIMELFSSLIDEEK